MLRAKPEQAGGEVLRNRDFRTSETLNTKKAWNLMYFNVGFPESTFRSYTAFCWVLCWLGAGVRKVPPRCAPQFSGCSLLLLVFAVEGLGWEADNPFHEDSATSRISSC